MKRWVALIRRFLSDEEGATAVEYGIMVALIAAVIISTVALLGGRIQTAFVRVVDELVKADPCATTGPNSVTPPVAP